MKIVSIFFHLFKNKTYLCSRIHAVRTRLSMVGVGELIEN